MYVYLLIYKYLFIYKRYISLYVCLYVCEFVFMCLCVFICMCGLSVGHGNLLIAVFCCILKHNVLVIGGDMNALIGKNINHKFSSHNSSNRNGENLTDYSRENRLTCLKRKFQKRKGKL